MAQRRQSASRSNISQLKDGSKVVLMRMGGKKLTCNAYWVFLQYVKRVLNQGNFIIPPSFDNLKGVVDHYWQILPKSKKDEFKAVARSYRRTGEFRRRKEEYRIRNVGVWKPPRRSRKTLEEIEIESDYYDNFGVQDDIQIIAVHETETEEVDSDFEDGEEEDNVEEDASDIGDELESILSDFDGQWSDSGMGSCNSGSLISLLSALGDASFEDHQQIESDDDSPPAAININENEPEQQQQSSPPVEPEPIAVQHSPWRTGRPPTIPQLRPNNQFPPTNNNHQQSSRGLESGQNNQQDGSGSAGTMATGECEEERRQEPAAPNKNDNVNFLNEQKSILADEGPKTESANPATTADGAGSDQHNQKVDEETKEIAASAVNSEAINENDSIWKRKGSFSDAVKRERKKTVETLSNKKEPKAGRQVYVPPHRRNKPSQKDEKKSEDSSSSLVKKERRKKITPEKTTPSRVRQSVAAC